jgi:hypothetical protein
MQDNTPLKDYVALSELMGEYPQPKDGKTQPFASGIYKEPFCKKCKGILSGTEGLVYHSVPDPCGEDGGMYVFNGCFVTVCECVNATNNTPTNTKQPCPGCDADADCGKCDGVLSQNIVYTPASFIVCEQCCRTNPDTGSKKCKACGSKNTKTKILNVGAVNPNPPICTDCNDKNNPAICDCMWP